MFIKEFKMSKRKQILVVSDLVKRNENLKETVKILSERIELLMEEMQLKTKLIESYQKMQTKI